MRQWSILTAVAVIIVFAAGWFLLVKPQRAKSTDLRSQATTQEQANQVLLSQIAALQQEEKNLPQQQAALRKFSTQVPDNAAEPTIIRQLSAAAAGAGVDLVSMTPGTAAPVVAPATAPTTTAPGTTSTTTAPATGTTSLTPSTSASGLVQLPISIGIIGSYPNVETFFQSLEKLPRSILITGWSLCPEQTTGSATGSSSSGCAAPTAPANKTLSPDSLGGTLSATVFYAPPAGTVTTGTSLTPATTTTAPTTGSTAAPSTAATPATTGATSAPAS
jgi:Tfp pilus assembly protein PilO